MSRPETDTCCICNRTIEVGCVRHTTAGDAHNECWLQLIVNEQAAVIREVWKGLSPDQQRRANVAARLDESPLLTELAYLREGLRDMVSLTAVYGEAAGEKAAELLQRKDGA